MTDQYQNNDWEMQCPKCGSTEMSIQIKVWCRLYEEGSEVAQGDHEWTGESPAVCIDCDFEGKVSDFENAYQAAQDNQD